MPDSIALNCDCMEYMKTLPDNAFGLAVVDPPYGDASDTYTHTHTPRSNATVGTDGTSTVWTRFGGRFDRYKTMPRERDADGQSRKLARKTEVSQRTVERTGGTWAAKYGKKIIAWDVAPGQEYFDELFRVSRNQIIWGGNYFCLPPTRCFLIWRKTNIPLDGFSMAPVEYAWTSFNKNAACFEYSSLRGEDAGKFHPTEKPIALYRWIFRKYAKQSDKILDTHLGSGSSRIAAYDAGLDFVGCEIDETYFRLQEERFEQHTAQQNLFLQSGLFENQGGD